MSDTKYFMEGVNSCCPCRDEEHCSEDSACDCYTNRPDTINCMWPGHAAVDALIAAVREEQQEHIPDAGKMVERMLDKAHVKGCLCIPSRKYHKCGALRKTIREHFGSVNKMVAKAGSQEQQVGHAAGCHCHAYHDANKCGEWNRERAINEPHTDPRCIPGILALAKARLEVLESTRSRMAVAKYGAFVKVDGDTRVEEGSMHLADAWGDAIAKQLLDTIDSDIVTTRTGIKELEDTNAK